MDVVMDVVVAAVAALPGVAPSIGACFNIFGDSNDRDTFIKAVKKDILVPDDVVPDDVLKESDGVFEASQCSRAS